MGIQHSNMVCNRHSGNTHTHSPVSHGKGKNPTGNPKLGSKLGKKAFSNGIKTPASHITNLGLILRSSFGFLPVQTLDAAVMGFLPPVTGLLALVLAQSWLPWACGDVNQLVATFTLCPSASQINKMEKEVVSFQFLTLSSNSSWHLIFLYMTLVGTLFFQGKLRAIDQTRASFFLDNSLDFTGTGILWSQNHLLLLLFPRC